MRLKSLLAIVLLSLSTSAGAKAVPISSLFWDGEAVFAGNVAQYAFGYDAANVYVNTFASTQANDGSLSRIDLSFQAKRLSAAELQLAKALAWRVASQCMNIDRKRKAALLNWLTQQNKMTSGKKLAQFGPMTVRFERGKDDDGYSYTAIGLGRDQKPGVAPWVNYCRDE